MKTKKAQSEIVTTVILILVALAAVALVSTFVINMVRNNLKGTDCFETAGQLKIKPDFSFFNETSKNVTVVVERGNNDFNLTGISIVYGTERQTKKVQLFSGLPSTGESRIFNVNTVDSSFTEITTIAVSPIINKNTECDKSDEKQIVTLS